MRIFGLKIGKRKKKKFRIFKRKEKIPKGLNLYSKRQYVRATGNSPNAYKNYVKMQKEGYNENQWESKNS